jgi:hypothetical protein
MKDALAPCPELVRKVRANFVLQGTTLGRWCRENGIPRQNARDTLLGGWDGPKGRELRAKILKAAGLVAKAAA